MSDSWKVKARRCVIPDPLGWGLGVALTTSVWKNLLLTKTIRRPSLTQDHTVTKEEEEVNADYSCK
jgi:hypothetical protein